MHELAITQHILTIAVSHAQAGGAARITAVRLVVGQLSSMVDDSVQFYWDIISAGTIAEGARLHFRRVPAQMTCPDCGAVYPLRSTTFNCPTCGGERGHVSGGDEFYVEAIDVELAEGAAP